MEPSGSCIGRTLLVIGHYLPCVYFDLGSVANFRFKHIHSSGNMEQGEGWLHMEQNMVTQPALYLGL